MIGRLIEATRRNHALEHATITVLLGKLGMNVRLAGRSTPSGFVIQGNIPTEALEEAVKEGLRRLQAGEAELAVSPLCGTNLAVGGILAGTAATLALGRKGRWEGLPNAILAAMMALLAAQPLGRLAQRHLTTSTALAGATVEGITRRGSGHHTVHRVVVRQAHHDEVRQGE